MTEMIAFVIMLALDNVRRILTFLAGCLALVIIIGAAL